MNSSQASNLTTAMDPGVEDFQSRLSAAQEVQERVASTGQRVEITSSGHLVLYHGTSEANAEKIRASGKFFGWVFFAPNKSAVEPHARPKHGASMVAMRVLVDPRDVEFSTGSGEFFAPEALVMSDGMWSAGNGVDRDAPPAPSGEESRQRE